MLTFLNSAILLGLSAVAIPILIHLFTRKKVKTVYFSSLRFLIELQKHKIRRLKIRQILLLIVRALIILALVLAFARPALKSSSASSLESGAQITAVIILDNTLSMGREFAGKRLLDIAKQRALEVLNLLRPGDEIYLLYPQAPPKFAHKGPRYSLDTVRELIENTELSFRTTDYLSTFRAAEEILRKSQNINKEVYFISDMQKNGLRPQESGDGAKLFDKHVNVFVLPVQSTERTNLDIASVRLANQILERDKVVEIESELRSHSQHRLKDRLVHLFVNGKRVGQQALDFEATSTQKVLFKMIPDRTGFQSGFVQLEDDELLDDNTRYFTYRILDEIPVLIVTGPSANSRYLKLALHPEKTSTTNVTVDEIDYNKFPEQNLNKYRVVVFANVPRLDNVASLKLQKFVAAGGGFLVFLGEDVNLRNYNETIQRKMHLPLLSETYGNATGEQFLSLGKIDFSHPIFRGVFEEDQKQISSPHIRFVVKIHAEKPIDTIIEYSNGQPFLFETSFRKGSVMYFTTGLSNNWSDLVFKGIFVPLIYRSITYLAGGTVNERNDFLIGDEIAYRANKHLSHNEIVMRKPDSTDVHVKPEIAQGDYLIRFHDTELPGIYSLYSGGTRLAQWAVNYDPEETMTTPFKTKVLANHLAANQVVEIQLSDDIAERLEQSRFGRELWKYFIALALILTVLEMAVMRETSKVSVAHQAQDSKRSRMVDVGE
ncbi:MAG: BatA domain-containing protein [bacterium]